MKLYVSGGITGISNAREQFEKAAVQLVEHGHEALNPFELDKCSDQKCLESPEPDYHARFGISHPHTYACCLRYDIIGMLQCDGVALLPNWRASRGSKWERDVALLCGLQVKDIADWLALT